VPSQVARLLASQYRRTQQRILRVAEELDDDQLRRTWPHANSIGFDVWHCARWADHLQSILPDATPALRTRLGRRDELWERDGLARRWSFPAELGQMETGMGMDESTAASLPLPTKAELLGYVRAVFDLSADVVDRLEDDDLPVDAKIDDARVPWLSGRADKGPVGNWVLTYDGHANRHLGMIELRRGLLGMRGTATA
jgi:hypothetical protein